MVPRSGSPRVGYVVSRFPKLSETFVLREMDALESCGWHVVLYPLITQTGGLEHPDAVPWTRRARSLPMLSMAVLLANLRVLLRRPRAYGLLWARVLRGYAGAPQALVRALALLPSAVRLAEMVRQDRVSQLHAHFATYPLLACWVVNRLTGVPYSVTVHAHDLFTGTPMLAEKLHYAGAVVAISQYNRDFLAREVDPALLDKTTVVHCGVVPSRYGGRAGRPSADRPLEVLCVGSLAQYKGQVHLVEAVRVLRERGREVRCVLVGDGPDREQLRAVVDAAGLADLVVLTGPRTEDEVAELMRHADVYVQPSVVADDGQMEGIPVALMEALASRLPVVATALSGIPELVRDGETGWLVPPGDVEALVRALEQVASDPAAAVRRAQAGRELVEREFDLHHNVRKLAHLLGEVAPTMTRDVPA